MRSFLLIVLILFNNPIFCQDYFSEIIPFEFGNPTVASLIYEQGSYIIPTIYIGNNTVIILHNIDKTDYLSLDSFTISKDGLCSFDNSEYYIFGKDRSKSKGLKILSSDFEYSSPTSENIETEGDFNFPTTASKLRDSIFYCTFTKDIDALNAKLPELLMLNLKSNEKVRVKFNSDLVYTIPWVIGSTLDGNIFISSGIQFPTISKRLGQLIKMDGSGNIIWRNDGNEDFENGGVPAWAAQLSDSTIVQTYYIDRRSDMEFIANNWFELPIRLKWYNKDGDSIAEKLIITPKKEYITYNGLKKGNGNYFFAYGQYEDSNPIINDIYYTHLIKFSNRGDTIWVRNYQHPEFEEPRVTHSINDIFEHENGDISILATIRRTAEKNEIWLYKVNSDGCYINDECEDMTDLVSTEETQYISQPLLFPNPALDVLHITLNERQFSHIDIKDQLGNTQISFQSPIDSNVEIDISQLSTGVYYAILHLNNGEKMVKRFVKL